MLNARSITAAFCKGGALSNPGILETLSAWYLKSSSKRLSALSADIVSPSFKERTSLGEAGVILCP